MRKVILGLSLVVLTVGLAFSQEKIMVGYMDNPPNINTEQGKATGVLVDYWENYIAPAMQVKIEWVGPLPPSRSFQMLQDGEINCIALISKNPERAKIYDFSDKPTREVTAGIAILKKNQSTITSVNSLQGKIVTFIKDGFIPDIMKKVDIKWDLISSPTWKVQGFRKLVGERVDAVFDPDIATLDYVQAQKDFSAVVMTIPLRGTESLNYAMFSKKDNGKYVTLYNKARATDTVSYADLLKKSLAKQ